MAKTFVPYEPNEYESMMIAAGWITIESCDDEYQAYLKRCTWDAEYRLTYTQWQSTCREWIELDAEYDNVSITDGKPPLERTPAWIKATERELLDRMNRIEVILGY